MRPAETTGPMPVVARERHEGLVAWLVGSIARVPLAIVAIVAGFLREVGAVLRSIGDAVLRLVPFSGALRRTATRVAGSSPDARAPGRVERDVPVTGRTRAPRAPVVLTPSQERARDRRRALLQRRIRIGLALGVLLSALVAWRIVPSADVFRVGHVEVLGANSVGDLEVRTRVDDLLEGQTIYTADLDEIEQRIEGLPFVRSASVDRHFPNGLSLRIVEHQPLALGFDAAESTWWLIAPDGRVLAPGNEADWRDRIPLVRLDTGDVKAGMRLEDEPAVALLRAMPSDSTLAVTAIEVEPYAVTAIVQGDVEVRFGRPDQLRTKLASAERMLAIAQRKGLELRYVDVAVPGFPVYCRVGNPCATIDVTAQGAEAATDADADADANANANADAGTTAATAEDADAAAAADDGAVTATTTATAAGPSRVAAAVAAGGDDDARSTAELDDEDAPDAFDAAVSRVAEAPPTP